MSHKSEDGSAMASSLVLLAMVRNNGMHDKDLMEVDKDFGERVVSSTNDALRRLCRLPVKTLLAPCQNWVAVLRSCWCCFTSSIDRHLAQDTIEVQDLMCDCLHV